MAEDKHGEALAVFLKMVETDKGWNDAAARKAMLKVFDIAGRAQLDTRTTIKSRRDGRE